MTDEPRDLEQPIPAAPTAYGAADIEFLKDPHATLRDMRSEARLHHARGRFAELGFGAGHLALTHYADANDVLRSREHIVDVRKLPEGDPRRRSYEGRGANALPPNLSELDPPEHDRLRGLVNKAFTPRAIELIKPRITEIAHDLLDAVEGQSEIDFIETFATPLPILVIAELVGVPPSDRDRFTAWMNRRSFSPADFTNEAALVRRFEEQRLVVSAVADYLRERVELRRAEPGDDLISRLIEVEADGDRLAEAEMISLCAVLFGGGILSTTGLLGSGLLTLLRHPDQMQLLRRDPELLPSAIEEMLRYTPPVTSVSRFTRQETEIAGCPVGTHRTLTPSLIAANRDPAVFDDPDRFDVTREENRHLSFGAGLHYCIGAPLVRAEAAGALQVLLQRYEHIEMATPFEDVEWVLRSGFLGPRSLPLRVRPRT